MVARRQSASLENTFHPPPRNEIILELLFLPKFILVNLYANFYLKSKAYFKKNRK